MSREKVPWYKTYWVLLAGTLGAVSTVATQFESIKDIVEKTLYPEENIAIHDPSVKNWQWMKKESDSSNPVLSMHTEVEVILTKKSIPPIGPCRFTTTSAISLPLEGGQVDLPRGVYDKRVVASFDEYGHFSLILPQKPVLRLECPHSISTTIFKSCIGTACNS